MIINNDITTLYMEILKIKKEEGPKLQGCLEAMQLAFKEKAKKFSSVSEDDPVYIEFKKTEAGQQIIESFQRVIKAYKDINLLMMAEAHDKVISGLSRAAIPLYFEMLHRVKHKELENPKQRINFFDIFDNVISGAIDNEATLMRKELKNPVEQNATIH